MSCPWQDFCGGCIFRSYTEAEYREHKQRELQRILSKLPVVGLKFGTPVFVGDGARRRATFAFSKHKGQVILGFNRHHSSELINVENCPLLTPEINAILPELRKLISELCDLPFPSVKKHKRRNQS